MNSDAVVVCIALVPNNVDTIVFGMIPIVLTAFLASLSAHIVVFG